MKIRFIAVGVLLSLVLVGSIACGDSTEITNQTAKVARGDLIIMVSSSGTVEVSHEVNLSFGINGRIERLLVEEGDKVSQGQVIGKLESDSLELAYIRHYPHYFLVGLSIIKTI